MKQHALHSALSSHLNIYFLLSATLLLTACTPAPTGPPVVPAEGTVLLDDKPLSGANVMFEPQGDTRGDRGSFATTDANGKFAIASPDGKRKGTAVGHYKVVINKLVTPEGKDFVPDPNSGPEDTGGFREVLPKTYSDAAVSTLTAEVPPTGTKTLEFKLKSKQK